MNWFLTQEEINARREKLPKKSIFEKLCNDESFIGKTAKKVALVLSLPPKPPVESDEERKNAIAKKVIYNLPRDYD